MSEKKTIYNLELHESMIVTTSGEYRTEILATRVPGGWLYDMDFKDGMKPVFVPFRKEAPDA